MKCKVIDIRRINEDYFFIKFANKEIASKIEPGQFVTVKLKEETPGQRLRIPLSIYQADSLTFTLFVKILGEGTKILSEVKRDEELDVLGPLGTGFSLLQNKNILFVTGGVGYPPLMLLKDRLTECNVTWVHGGRSSGDIFSCDYGYTEDGTSGKKGLVTQDLEEIIRKHNIEYVYSCGPNGMMKAVYSILKRQNIPYEVSLEEYMACGIGVCYGCAVEVISEDSEPLYKRVCKDGPVFNAEEIVWESI